MNIRFILLWMVGAAAVAGCTDLTPKPGQLECTVVADCPPHWICGKDLRCYPEDWDAGDLPCIDDSDSEGTCIVDSESGADGDTDTDTDADTDTDTDVDTDTDTDTDTDVDTDTDTDIDVDGGPDGGWDAGPDAAF